MTPGAWLRGARFTCGPGCPTVACHPALDHWSEAASHDRLLVHAWWRLDPYSVLLPTGRAFDVLDLPTHLGLVAATAMLPGASLSSVVRVRSGLRGPVAVTPAGRWMLLVSPGGRLWPELAIQPDVVLHSGGSWIPAPPTRMAEGRVRWHLSPEAAGWRLPDAHAIQESLLAALPAIPDRLIDRPKPPKNSQASPMTDLTPRR